MLLFGILAGLLIFWRSLGQEATAPSGSVVTAEAPLPVTPVAPTANAVPPNTEMRTNLPEEKTAAPEISSLRNNAAVLDLSEQAPSIRVVPKPKKGKTEAKHAVTRVPSTRVTAPVTPPKASDGIPFLPQMPLAFQRQLPPLKVTIHVYSPEESQRILFLNNREYREGEQIEAGVRVEEIVSDGVVLSYQGERFKVSRPN
jgi:general secretion pathway protein B